MSRPKLEVADVFRRHGAAWRAANKAHLSLAQRRVMTAIEVCRTAALGGHVERMADLSKLKHANAWRAYLAPLRKSEWVVHAKKPFAGPQQVLAYLARYTHRVAISNSRLLDLDATH